jgi:hypothetical protein
VTTGGFGVALPAYAIAGAMLTTLRFTLALITAGARERSVQAFVSGAPRVKRWGARVMLVVGAWFIIVAIFGHFFAQFFSS